MWFIDVILRIISSENEFQSVWFKFKCKELTMIVLVYRNNNREFLVDLVKVGEQI